MHRHSADDIRARLNGGRFHYPLNHGTMRAGLYAPRGEDKQTPHSQDEIYIVNRGNAVFVHNDESAKCAAGDLLFVPAGGRHHFERMSDDFETWVVFYGAEGGEAGRMH